MAETIVIRLHDVDGIRTSWHPLGTRPSPAAPKGYGSLEQASSALKGWRVIGIVPSTEILLTQVNIPTKNRQRLIQAIPFSLENHLTEEVDNLHFAIAQIDSNEDIAVGVITRGRIDYWMDLFKSHGFHPLALYPDVLCLPLTPNHWTIYVDKHEVLVRTDRLKGFVAETDNIQALLNIAMDSIQPLPEQLDLIHSADLDDTIDIHHFPQDVRSHSTQIDATKGLIPLMAENLKERENLNLLQGDYKQVDKKTIRWKRWLPAAALAILSIGLYFVSNVIEYHSYQAKNEQLSQEIHQVFRKAFPEIKRIVDPKVQMEQQLKILKMDRHGEQADFLSLLSTPAITIMKRPGNQLEDISYRDGQLDLKLIIKELQVLEILKKEIEAQDLLVEIRSANATGDRVSAHLRIKRGRS